MTVARRFLHVGIIVLTLIVGAAAAAIVVSQTASFKDWLRGYVVREANQFLNGELSIQRLSGNLFFGIEMEDVAVSLDGSEVVSVKDLGLDYSIFDLLWKGFFVDEMRLNQLMIHLRREGDGWSIRRLIKKQEREADREGPAYPIAISAIGISDASIVVDDPVGTSGVDVPNRIDCLDAQLSFEYQPVHYSLEIAHVSFRGSDPAIGLNALSGGVAVRDDTVYLERIALRTEESSLSVAGAIQQYLTAPVLNLEVSSDKLSIPEMARVVPALAGIRLQPAFELKLAGPAESLAVEMNVRSAAGQATGTFVADFARPGHSVTGRVSVRHLNLAPIVNDAQRRTDLTADAQVDLRAASASDLESMRGTAAVNAPRLVASGYAAEHVKVNAEITGRRIDLRGQASAYGTAATAAGRVTLAGRTEPLSYDLRGRARHLDLRRLPRELNVPPAETHVNAGYHVRGIEPGRAQQRVVDSELRFDESTVAGARVARGSTAAVSIRGREIEYQVDATVADLDLQRIGREFNVPALAADRYTSALNGHVQATGRGTNVREMEVTAKGTLNDSTILGGRVPQLSFDFVSTDDTARVTASGAFADFDPAALSGRPAMRGMVSGSLDVDATIDGLSTGVRVDNVEGTGRVTLEPSTVGGLAIERAAIDGDYRNRSGQIRQLDITGRDLNVKASGTLALDDTGESNLTFEADTSRLEEIGKLVDMPVSGLARIDGTVTGNGAELRATGALTGSGVKYGENGALSLATTYTARVPDLAFSRAEVTADTKATFVTLAGQDINEVTAKTTYADKQIAFDAMARQPRRWLAMAGSMLLHPDHREVHVQRLALDTEGLSWQVAPGSQAALQYGDDAIVVHDLRLVSGDQQISADGTFGRPGDALTITLTNVDLAGVDALLLRPPQFTGRLDATGVVGGSRQAPEVEAEFQVRKGGFRKFQYETFAGTVDYERKGFTVDTRLQQNPTQWITAKGYVPLALFAARASEPARPADERHVAVFAPEDRVDLTVDSSPIELGVIQGFNDAVRDVKGTLEAHLRITGSAEDPHPSGAITVRDGAMTIEPTGVAYRNIAGRIDLQPDRAHIDQITVLDDHDSALSVTGDLAIHERQVGGMAIYVTADDFKIVDNDLGTVRVHSRLEVGGELRSPELKGYLGVTTGQINIDEIVALTGPSPYPTKPAEFTASPSSSDNDLPSARGVFDRLQMDVHVTVPNDLVVKASDLQTPGSASPIGLGALTVTLGGDVRAMKEPGGRVRLTGTVNTVRGSYDFQGRRFEILRDGALRFDGLEDLDPALDLRASRIIQAVDVRVNVRGTLKKPEVVLSSTPPLEPADILSLVVFNQPMNLLGEGQQISLVERAQALAAGAITAPLAHSIGRALHLDTFEIDIAPERGGGPSLTIGEQLGQDLYVKVEQGIGEQGSTNFILEYELADWLRLQANVLQGASIQQSLFRRLQGSGADLIFFFSF